MLSYGSLTSVQREVPETGLRRGKFHQSQTPWAANARQSEIYFHTETMESTLISDQGAWSAHVRHGQATVQQHPAPLKMKLPSTKPQAGEEEENPAATSSQIDGAQLHSLLTVWEVSLPDVLAAMTRRAESKDS